jgi:hypothetical protein
MDFSPPTRHQLVPPRRIRMNEKRLTTETQRAQREDRNTNFH